MFLHGFESLWMPASLLEKNTQPVLVKALFRASRFKEVQLHMHKGLAGATPEARAAARQTATNPAVLDAFALVIIADGEGPAYPGLSRPPLDLSAARTDARAIDLATAELRKIVPDAGSYLSESNYFNPLWQRAYWGATTHACALSRRSTIHRACSSCTTESAAKSGARMASSGCDAPLARRARRLHQRAAPNVPWRLRARAARQEAPRSRPPLQAAIA